MWGGSGRVGLAVGVTGKLSCAWYAREEQLGPCIVRVVWEGASSLGGCEEGEVEHGGLRMVRFVFFNDILAT